MTETPDPNPYEGHEGPDQQPPTYAQPQHPQPNPQQPNPQGQNPQPPYPQQPYAPSPYAQHPAYQQPAYGYADPGAGALTQSDRTWASAAHWGTLVAAWLAMGFLAPLIIMLTIGNQSPYVRRHAVESLNFQISLLIYGAAALFFSLITIGIGLIIVIPLGLVAIVAILVFLIQASIKANNGEDYRYPLTLRFVS